MVNHTIDTHINVITVLPPRRGVHLGLFGCLPVCLSGRVTHETIAPTDFILFTQDVFYPWLGRPLG